MLVNVSKIKKGLYFEKNNKYYKIIDFLHVKPGKGNAFIRTKIKNLSNGNIIKEIFPSGTKINQIDLVSKRYNFLYQKNKLFYFINKKNYNIISLSYEILKNYYKFLKKNDEVEIIFIKDNNKPLFVKEKKYIVLKVVSSDINIQGNTVKNKLKKSILETGLSIYTPQFIKPGDFIKINTKKLKYIERIKH